MRTRVALIVLVCLACASLAVAQPTINATKVEVSASPDHSLSALGVALVDSYRLTYKDGATVIGTPQNAGKPTPNAGGTFDVTIPAAVLAVKNKNLTVLVEIVGPGGVRPEPVSGFFGYLDAPRASGSAGVPKP